MIESAHLALTRNENACDIPPRLVETTGARADARNAKNSMDETTPVIRHFRRILPQPTRLPDEATLRELRVWLSDDVGKLIDGLSRRPTFREHAAWALCSLRADSDSDERSLINDLELALCDASKAYVKLLDNKRISSQLKISFPPRSCIVGETVEISGIDKPKVLSRKTRLIDEQAIETSRLRHLRKQGPKAFALVNLNDYFEPQQEFAPVEDGRRIQVGTHIVSLTPELHPVGNFIQQSAVRRLDGHLELLAAVRSKIAKATRDLGRTYRDQQAAQAAWDRLQYQVKRFRRTFQSGPQNALHNACMLLTQIYAAFHPAPELDWLGVSDEAIQVAQDVLRQRIRGFRSGELFERVADALIEIRRLYENRDSEFSAREAAVAGGGLVLVTAERTLYWEGKPLAFTDAASRAAWEILVPLVKKSQTGGFVTEQDVFGDKVTGLSGMPMRMQRLKKLLPGSLRKLIVPGPELRTYRLHLERARIFLC